MTTITCPMFSLNTYIRVYSPPVFIFILFILIEFPDHCNISTSISEINQHITKYSPLQNRWNIEKFLKCRLIFFHSASFENPIFGTCRAGWNSDFQLRFSTRSTGTENRIFKGGAMKNSIHITRNKTQRKHFVWLQLSFHSGSKLHTHAIALFRPL